MSNACVCGHKTIFMACCGRFLRGGRRAKTPERPMRARYAAHALGGYGD